MAASDDVRKSKESEEYSTLLSTRNVTCVSVLYLLYYGYSYYFKHLPSVHACVRDGQPERKSLRVCRLCGIHKVKDFIDCRCA